MPELVGVSLLRERDFGYLEGKPFGLKASDQPLSPGAAPKKEPESREMMAVRMNAFIDDYILPLLSVEAIEPESQTTVLVISHGVILTILWKCILDQLYHAYIHLSDEVRSQEDSIKPNFVVGWSNTAFLQLCFTSRQPSQATGEGLKKLGAWSVEIEELGCVDHLDGLKRARGGIGSAEHDPSQKSLDSFFMRKPRLS